MARTDLGAGHGNLISWTDLPTAQKAMDDAFKKWEIGGSAGDNVAHQTKLKKWMAKTPKDSESAADLFSFKVVLDDTTSLGTIWTHTGSHRPAGNTVAITLKRSRHSPGYAVYTSHPE